jgi:hypothetical protein
MSHTKSEMQVIKHRAKLANKGIALCEMSVVCDALYYNNERARITHSLIARDCDRYSGRKFREDTHGDGGGT